MTIPDSGAMKCWPLSERGLLQRVPPHGRLHRLRETSPSSPSQAASATPSQRCPSTPADSTTHPTLERQQPDPWGGSLPVSLCKFTSSMYFFNLGYVSLTGCVETLLQTLPPIIVSSLKLKVCFPSQLSIKIFSSGLFCKGQPSLNQLQLSFFLHSKSLLSVSYTYLFWPSDTIVHFLLSMKAEQKNPLALEILLVFRFVNTWTPVSFNISIFRHASVSSTYPCK